MKNKFSSGIIVLIILVIFGIGYSTFRFVKSQTAYQLKNSTFAGIENSEIFDTTIAKSYKKNFIAALYLEGTIEESNYTYNQKWLLSTIENLKYNKKNSAIALYINSPGGAVYQADEVYLALQDYKKQTGRPIYVYQGPLAASGGYYISCAADKIYANRNTLTGSIGVIMGTAYDLTELFENIGIESTTIHSGQNKNMMNYNEPFTAEQQEIMQSICDECYEQFVSIVANSRDLDYSDAEYLADGRIYTAKQALENNLIDHIDSWEHMIEDLAETIEKPGIRVVTYKRERKNQNLLDYLTGASKEFATSAAAAKLGIPAKVIEDINNTSIMPMYLMSGNN